VFAVAVTRNYFTALGVPMAIGRGILPVDPDHVIVLRHEFWRTHFNGDPSIVGRAIRIDGQPWTVVGVLPAGHRTLIGFGFAPDVYVPASQPDTVLAMYGRIERGASLGGVRDHLAAVAARIDSTFPQDFKYAASVRVEPVAGVKRMERELMTVGLFFALLLTVVGLVLLMACVNVAGLLLARASTRRREMAIRLSLGASRGRLLQQLLVESLLLAVSGAAVGLLLAQGVSVLVARLDLPVPLPLRLHADLDWRVAVYAALATVIAAVATGLLPARQAVKEAIAPDLPRRSSLGLRRLLVGGQVAVSIVVLAVAALFLRNLFAASSIDPGFDLSRTVRAEVNLPANAYQDAAAVRAYVARALPVLAALPGVESVAAARVVPFTDATRFSAALTFPDTAEKVQASFNWNAVTPGYFQTLSIPVLQGRDVAESDRAGERVVVVNRAFVSRYIGARPPLGTVFLWGRDGREPFRIVGVVADTKNMTVGEDDRPQLYQPLGQIVNDRRRLQFVLRAAAPPALLVRPVARALRQLEPAAGTEVATLYSSIGLAFLPSQVGAVLMGTVGVLGIVLAAVGLYGMTAYSVARRVQEIGVRMALGASAAGIVRLVLVDALAVVAVGAVIGLAVAAVVLRPLGLFLVTGVTPGDPITFAAVLAVLGITAAVASWGPARVAARIEPMAALRHD
jgi:predicted permease